MLMVLYAFTPCAIKNVLFDAVDATYEKPISKSNSTFQISNCQDFSNVKQTNNSKSEVYFANANLTPSVLKIGAEIPKLQPTASNYSGKTSGNNPPLYILFKRLKIDLMLPTSANQSIFV